MATEKDSLQEAITKLDKELKSLRKENKFKEIRTSIDKLRETVSNKSNIVETVESQLDELISDSSDSIKEIKERKRRISNIQNSIKQSKDAFDATEYENLMSQVNMASDTINNDLKKKRNLFKRAGKGIRKYSSDMAAITSGMLSSNPMVMLGTKMVGDTVSGAFSKLRERKEQKAKDIMKMRDALFAQSKNLDDNITTSTLKDKPKSSFIQTPQEEKREDISLLILKETIESKDILNDIKALQEQVYIERNKKDKFAQLENEFESRNLNISGISTSTNNNLIASKLAGATGGLSSMIQNAGAYSEILQGAGPLKNAMIMALTPFTALGRGAKGLGKMGMRGAGGIGRMALANPANTLAGGALVGQLGMAISEAKQTAKEAGASEGAAFLAEYGEKATFGMSTYIADTKEVSKGWQILFDDLNGSLKNSKANYDKMMSIDTRQKAQLDVLAEQKKSLSKLLDEKESADDIKKARIEQKIQDKQLKILKLQERILKNDPRAKAKVERIDKLLAMQKKLNDPKFRGKLAHRFINVLGNTAEEAREKIEKLKAQVDKDVAKIKTREVKTSNGREKKQIDANKILDGSLGSISRKYESRGNAGTISTGVGDPGGKSYGSYQLSSNKGVLQSFINQSGFKNEFDGLKIGSPAFDKKWKELAQKYPDQFAKEQHDFIKRTHFDPVAKEASKMGYDLSDKRIREALFSSSVQTSFSGNKEILKNADPTGNTEEQINSLYMARKDYVARKGGLNSRTEQAVMKRYDRERKDVLAMRNQDHIQVASLNQENMKLRNQRQQPVVNNTVVNQGGSNQSNNQKKITIEPRASENTFIRNNDRAFKGTTT